MLKPYILIVEDEEDLLALARPFFLEAGYHPLLARSASEALRLWEPFQENIVMIITDWVLPDLFGDQLVTRLLEQKPSLKTIFISANPIASVEAPFPLKSEITFFQKPFFFLQLLRVVEQTLADRTPEGVRIAHQK